MAKDVTSKKYVFWAIVAILIILSYFMLKPYLIYIVSAFILAYITKPIYDFLRKKTNKPISGLLCVLLVTVVIILPIAIVVGSISNQAYSFLTKDNLSQFKDKVESYKLLGNINLDELINKIIQFSLSLITSTIINLPSMLLGILITFFGMYYMLLNWDYLKETFKKYIPFENKDETLKDISQATKGIIYGTVLIGIIEFVITAVGFYLIGVKYYLLFATIIFFTAFIPGIGPGAVWVPIAIYYIITERYLAAGLIIFVGLVLISILADNIIRAKILQKTSKINPFIMLIGIIGGVSVFGIFGFIIGPLVLVYTIKIIENSLEK